ncbi:MAG: hypothetical protein IKG58_00265 [Bacilli bacterium]|nr:hypothetical protein [Bacilli bacterium]MBR3048979.1 hypothetical protein [Bacilli bacterium]
MKKEEKNKKTVKKDNKKKEITKTDMLFVDIQIVVTLLTIIIAILFVLNKASFKLFELSLGVNLLIIAFNNYKVYKRSKLTVLYILVGIALLLCLGV